MARPSKLSPDQWAEIERRLAAGEKPADLAREFGIHAAQVTRRVSQVAQVVRNLAEKQAEIRREIATLPVRQQAQVYSLADDLVAVSRNLARAAVYASANAHRMHALANGEIAKVDDAEPLASIEALRNVSVLTKLGNASAEIPVALLNANTRSKDAGGLPRDKSEDEEGSAAALVRELKERRAAGGKTAMVPGMAAGLDDEG